MVFQSIFQGMARVDSSSVLYTALSVSISRLAFGIVLMTSHCSTGGRPLRARRR